MATLRCEASWNKVPPLPKIPPSRRQFPLLSLVTSFSGGLRGWLLPLTPKFPYCADTYGLLLRLSRDLFFFARYDPRLKVGRAPCARFPLTSPKVPSSLSPEKVIFLGVFAATSKTAFFYSVSPRYRCVATNSLRFRGPLSDRSPSSFPRYLSFLISIPLFLLRKVFDKVRPFLSSIFQAPLITVAEPFFTIMDRCHLFAIVISLPIFEMLHLSVSCVEATSSGSAPPIHSLWRELLFPEEYFRKGSPSSIRDLSFPAIASALPPASSY